MRSDTVASTIWPLISNDGHTGRAVKTEMRDMHIAYRFLVSGLRLDTTQPNLPGLPERLSVEAPAPSKYTPHLHFQKLLKDVRCCTKSFSEGVESNY